MIPRLKNSPPSDQPEQTIPGIIAPTNKLNLDASIMTCDNDDAILQVDGTMEPSVESIAYPFMCDTCHQGFLDPDEFIIHEDFNFKCFKCCSCYPVRIALDLHKCDVLRRNKKFPK